MIEVLACTGATPLEASRGVAVGSPAHTAIELWFICCDIKCSCVYEELSC